jgi:hypothetical protein
MEILQNMNRIFTQSWKECPKAWREFLSGLGALNPVKPPVLNGKFTGYANLHPSPRWKFLSQFLSEGEYPRDVQ